MSQSKIKLKKGWFRDLPAAPIEPEEFDRVMKRCDEAYYSDEPIEMPEFDIADDDGSVDRFQLNDTPYLRVRIAVMNYCGEDREKGRSMMTRIDAYTTILRSDEAHDWLLYDSDDLDPDATPIGVHPALIDVACTMPVKTAKDFNKTEFFRRVEEVARTKYPEIGNDG